MRTKSIVCLVWISTLDFLGLLAQEVRVQDLAGIRTALSGAKPGTVILVAPGDYEGFSAADLCGAEGRLIVIRGADPKHPPVFRSGLQFSEVVWFSLEGIVVEGAKANGINVDDGGSFDTPSRQVTLRDVVVRDCGGSANHDGIKLSGIVGFRLERCTVERWGRGGSAVDMVGCREGVIEGCTFRDREKDAAATGVQMKGGTRDVLVHHSRFEHAGERAVNLGGSTGLAYFRPKPEGFEAKDITVEHCTFVGSTAPLAFVGCDGAIVRRNTLYRPGKWVARILQETREPGFVASRQGSFTKNLIVYRSDEIRTAVNVGDATAPETFDFEGNYWFCLDDEKKIAPPGFPKPLKDVSGGANPMFEDASKGDFRLRARSPAVGFGASLDR